MPDLTEMGGWQCVSYGEFETSVPGRSGVYTVGFGPHRHNNPNVVCDWSCTCPSYDFQRGTDERGYCKHIRGAIVTGQRCGWSQRFDAGDPKDHGGCPKCGGPVEAVRWAV